MKELKDEELEKVTGGMTSEEVSDYLKKFWAFVPEEIRNKIVEVYEKSGNLAAYSFLKKLIEEKHLDLLNPLLDLFKED